LNSGKYDRGVIVAETFDYEIIDKVYRPYDNLSLLVNLKSTGTIEKKIIASVTESLKADYQFEDWKRLVEIFQNPSLQMISFTITEKGYSVAPADLERGLTPVLAMGKVTALLYERFQAGRFPLTVQSMDNCSHNGDKIKAGVMQYVERWTADGLVPADFREYVLDETKITFPWSMIDKITPRPHEKVQTMLAEDGFEDNYSIETEKHTFTAPFVNAEETEYLVIEDHYTNGRPPLELGGVMYTDRETVDKVETMKVTTCLNPLHTAMSIYGCLLGYTLISAEMADEDIRGFIQKIGYIEAMPVVTDPGILNPYEFIGAVLNRRLPNPFMPDAPQRIAMDTSQKLAIRFGETIKKYIDRGLDKSNLVLIPLVLAGYARYLKGIDDAGNAFEPSPDPLLNELQAIVAPLEIGKEDQDYSCLKTLYSRADVFGVDLYAAGLGEQIESMVKELYRDFGAVRTTLHKYVVAR
jgi:fructuronate reductase